MTGGVTTFALRLLDPALRERNISSVCSLRLLIEDMRPLSEDLEESGVAYTNLRELTDSGVMGCTGVLRDEKFVGVPALEMGDMLPLSTDGGTETGVAGGSYRATASSDRQRFGPGLLLLGLGRGMDRAMASNSCTCLVDESS